MTAMMSSAKDALVHRNHVDDESVPSPTAEWRSWGSVLGESQRAQPFRKGGVLRVGRHVYDRVDILRRSNAGRRGICDEQACRAAADEDEFV